MSIRAIDKMKQNKPYMQNSEAVGGVDACPDNYPFLHCTGLCKQTDGKEKGDAWKNMCEYCWQQPCNEDE